MVLGPLVLGGALLILRSVTQVARPLFASVAAGALLASIPTPFIVPLAFWYYQDFQYRSAYDPLCKDAFVKTIESVNQAKSAAFLPDSFVAPPESTQSEIGGWSIFLLNQSLLEYIERPATEESGLKGKAQFERVRTEGKRILSGNNPNERTKYVYEPIDKITAEYVVRPESLVVGHNHDFGLGGARIAIYRREDNKLISRTQYYWSNKLFQSCPVETRGGLFVYHFIAESLNVKNPEGPQRVLR